MSDKGIGLDSDISRLLLSTRTQNLLCQHRIKTVRDLLSRSDIDLKEYKNVGEGVVVEVLAALHRSGIPEARRFVEMAEARRRAEEERKLRLSPSEALHRAISELLVVQENILLRIVELPTGEADPLLGTVVRNLQWVINKATTREPYSMVPPSDGEDK